MASPVSREHGAGMKRDSDRRRLAYLGPAGTHSEQACISYDPDSGRVPYSSIEAAASAVGSGEADEVVLPIENSLGGSVPPTLDLLVQEEGLFIVREVVIPITHCLVVAEGTRTKEIKTIYSHPQALVQCRSYLMKAFSGTQQVASESTAAAVKDMLEKGSQAAAIATERAGHLYGAKLLAKGIEDNSNNVTRFVVLALSDHSPTGDDKTSICFAYDKDVAGTLYSTLGEFAHRGINLAKIESRPTREALGRYIFLVDLDGHRLDQPVAEALAQVRAQTSMFRLFGSYPKHRMRGLSRSG